MTLASVIRVLLFVFFCMETSLRLKIVQNTHIASRAHIVVNQKQQMLYTRAIEVANTPREFRIDAKFSSRINHESVLKIAFRP